MKVKSLVLGAATAAIIPTAGFAGIALADSPGQLGGGNEVYQVKNLTQNGSYTNTITANACDELKYSIELHNTSFGGFSSVDVKVNLPSNSSTTNTSTVTATTNLGGNTGTTGTATVNLSSAQSISYEKDSAVLSDVNGNSIKALPNTITSSGVNIGSLDGSTTEFVSFKAKVNCPSTPVTPTTPTTPATTAPKPTTLVNTGPGSVAAIFAAVSAAGAVSYRWMLARRLSRQ